MRLPVGDPENTSETVEKRMAIDTARQTARLKELLASAQERIVRLEKHEHREDGPLPADFSEQATETSNDETVAALLDQLRGEVRLANAALQRIEDGTYGTCTACGNLINEARLDLIPTASHCINCA